MSISRIVPNLTSTSLPTAQSFYGDLLGLVPVMDHGWIVTLADGSPTGPQLSVMTEDLTAPVCPDISIQVDDVDQAWAKARQLGAEIVHPITDEPWGVRRFFVRDPDGHVVNILGHR
jgi:catechol 2,3-dioxygenase-like lactoylglutathione lyase family enzyme